MPPAPGDFSWITTGDAGLLADAYEAVTKANAWEFFRTQKPPADKGYMFWNAPELREVETHMELLDAHSGASYAMVMRVMQYIAKNGWEAYISQRLEPRSYTSGGAEGAMY